MGWDAKIVMWCEEVGAGRVRWVFVGSAMGSGRIESGVGRFLSDGTFVPELAAGGLTIDELGGPGLVGAAQTYCPLSVALEAAQPGFADGSVALEASGAWSFRVVAHLAGYRRKLALAIVEVINYT